MKVLLALPLKKTPSLYATGLSQLYSTLLGFARLLFAPTGSSRSGLRTLIFAASLLFARLGVILLIPITAALIVLVVCHGMLLRLESAEITFDGLSKSICYLTTFRRIPCSVT
jgi:hypothetical protein